MTVIVVLALAAAWASFLTIPYWCFRGSARNKLWQQRDELVMAIFRDEFKNEDHAWLLVGDIESAIIASSTMHISDLFTYRWAKRHSHLDISELDNDRPDFEPDLAWQEMRLSRRIVWMLVVGSWAGLLTGAAVLLAVLARGVRHAVRPAQQTLPHAATPRRHPAVVSAFRQVPDERLFDPAPFLVRQRARQQGRSAISMAG